MRSLVNIEDVRRVEVYMPRKDDRFYWFDGQARITKKTFWTEIEIQDEIKKGWTWYEEPKSDRDILDLEKSTTYMLRDGEIWMRGWIEIFYKDGTSPFVFESFSESELNDYARILNDKLGDNFVEFIKD